MKYVTGTILVLSILTLFSCGSLLNAQPESLSKYNVIWNSPSTDASGQMPLGNGDIAAGVYAIENDALYLLLSKNDAFTYNGDIFKTGRFHNFNATPAFYKDRAYLYIQPGLEQA